MTTATMAAGRILRPGHNCWCLERAHRFYTIQDGADYFRLVRAALLRAQHTVFILGWDLTGLIDLEPGAPPSEAPTRLDKLIAHIARRRPQLRCYILTWDYGLLFTLERDPLSRWRFGWRMPRGVRFGFDDHHPVGACHHQKVVVVDDQLAFCGGMDLTAHRWDTSAHRPDEPSRTTPLGSPYGPYHEVQAMVEGPVAAKLGTLARDRWQAVSPERLPPVRSVRGADEGLWPDDVTPDFTDVDIAIARTVPASATRPAVRECEALFVDAIARARHSIYIENQYLTSRTLGDSIAARLAEPDGPEVVLILPRGGDGWLERHTIEVFRDEVFRRLLAADTRNRLRLVFPMASRARDLSTFVHSKVMIVDDVFLRIGSANLTQRSMGMDTECDLALDAGDDDAVREGIRGVRARLMAEQLGLSVPEAARAIAQTRSLRAVVDAHQDGDHTLVRFEPPPAAEADPPDAVRAAVDPDEPIGFGGTVERLIPPIDPSSGRAPLRVWVVPAGVLSVALLVAWTSGALFEGLELRSIPHLLVAIGAAPWATAAGVAVFLVGGFALIPLELLVVTAVVFLGPVRGGVVAVVGSFLAAVIGYLAGRLIGTSALARWMPRRSYRAARQLAASGIAGVAVLRLAAVASAASIHLLCGAARVPFGRYLAGTAIGLLPAILGLSAVGAVLRSALLNPSIGITLATVAAGAALVAVMLGLRTLLLIRQFAPSFSRHRQQTEFG